MSVESALLAFPKLFHHLNISDGYTVFHCSFEPNYQRLCSFTELCSEFQFIVEVFWFTFSDLIASSVRYLLQTVICRLAGEHSAACKYFPPEVVKSENRAKAG